MATTTTRDPWTPVRYGAHAYCSPACGRGCTIQEHGAALKLGAKIAMRMGKNWTVQVHENMGWFATVLSPCGRIKLSPSGARNAKTPLACTAFLGEPGSPGGRWAEWGATPELAVEAVLKKGKDAFHKMAKLLEGLV